MRGLINVLCIGIFIWLVTAGNASAIGDPYIVYGYVKYDNGNPVNGASISISVPYQSLTVTTNGDGKYISVLDNYTDGDTISVFASKDIYAGSTGNILDKGSGGSMMNVILHQGDIIPPGTITGLTSTSGNFWINWTWTNPESSDFSHAMISIDNVWQANVRTGFYNGSFPPHSKRSISIKTVDIHGTIYNTIVSQTASIPNNPVSLMNIPPSIVINEGQTVSVDAEATDLDPDIPVFSCNRTDLFTDFNPSTGQGSFTPSNVQSGTYHIGFAASDGYGSISNKILDITVIDVVSPPKGPGVIFNDDIESGINGWTASGLWHISTKRSASLTHSWWYGQDSTGNYDNGAANSGYLVSPSISLPASSKTTLSFNSWYKTESGTTWDKKIVQISTDGGNTWTDMKQISDTPSTWNPETIDLSSFAGKTISIRFSFDTIDKSYNNYEGWFIDDVKIETQTISDPAPTPEPGVIFSDDMESGTNGWVSTGLWHMSTRRFESPSQSWWYGQESKGNYNTGAANSGYLTSPAISLEGSANPGLIFNSWYKTESGTTWDKKIVQVSTDSGSTWTDVKQVSGTASTWNLETIDLSSYKGKTISIRFSFDTVDKMYNDHEGWYIDNVRIVG